MSQTMKEVFAERFRAMRKKKDWNQEEMAKKLEISRQAIVNYEQGKRIPDIEVLARIVTTCECSAYYLLGLQNEMNDKFAHMTDSVQLSEDALFYIDLFGDHIDIINKALTSEDFWDFAYCLAEIATGKALINQYDHRNPGDYIDFLKYQAHLHIDAMITNAFKQGEQYVDKEEMKEIAEKWSKREKRFLRMQVKSKHNLGGNQNGEQ